MYKLCKTEQSAKRQRQLEEGLLSAMCSCQYEEISVSDLCDQLGIPRKSFYRYFASKDGALQALLDHTLMEYETFALTAAPGEHRTVRRDLEHFFLFWYDKRRLLDALKRSALSSMLIDRAIVHVLSETVMPKRFLPHDTKEMQEQVIAFSISGLLSMVMSWHSTGYCQPPKKMAEVAIRLLSQPLFPDVGRYV